MSNTDFDREHFSIPDGALEFQTGFYSAQESDELLINLTQQIAWTTRTLRIHGKEILMPRMIAWYADRGVDYYYSGGTSPRNDWTSSLREIKEKIETYTKSTFNGVLLNLYRDGNDSMGWHSDNEQSLGENPVIASLSLGASRRFQLQHKQQKKLKHDIELTHGSLLIMRGTTQAFWRHQIAKDKYVTKPRINLTFRAVKL